MRNGRFRPDQTTRPRPSCPATTTLSAPDRNTVWAQLLTPVAADTFHGPPLYRAGPKPEKSMPSVIGALSAPNLQSPSTSRLVAPVIGRGSRAPAPPARVDPLDSKITPPPDLT